MTFLAGKTGRLFIINLLTAVSYAFILPVMSLYLINGLHAKPLFISFYGLGFALSGLFFSQLMGRMVDNGYSDKKLFIVSLLALFLAGVSFAVCQSPLQAVVTGIFLMGPGNASIPLLLSMIRKYSVTMGLNSTRLNTQMRSGVSIVWIVGPALAFIFADQYGFIFNFLASAVLSGLTMLLSLILLSDTKSRYAAHPAAEQRRIPVTVWLLGSVMLLANLSNNLYLTVMPLYLVGDLGMPAWFPGFLLGSTAILEIPVMLGAAHLAERLGKTPLMLAGFVAACAYYGLLQIAASMALLITLQLLNGVFFGIFVGLGISLIQEALPERSGFASAFYSNAMRLGMMAGNGIAGVAAQAVGFKMTLLVPLVSVMGAAGLMFFTSKRQQRKSQPHMSEKFLS